MGWAISISPKGSGRGGGNKGNNNFQNNKPSNINSHSYNKRSAARSFLQDQQE